MDSTTTKTPDQKLTVKPKVQLKEPTPVTPTDSGVIHTPKVTSSKKDDKKELCGMSCKDRVKVLRKFMDSQVGYKTRKLRPAAGNKHHRHSWNEPFINQDTRSMLFGKIEVSGSPDRQRNMSDDFALIRTCDCGACQAQHHSVGWCPVTKSNYGMVARR